MTFCDGTMTSFDFPNLLRHDVYGPVLDRLDCGVGCIVGCSWDVTDKDIDRLAGSFSLFISFSSKTALLELTSSLTFHALINLRRMGSAFFWEPANLCGKQSAL
jgi:hypothetical protein